MGYINSGYEVFQMNDFVLIMCLSISSNLLMLAYISHVKDQYYDIVYDLIRTRGVIWKIKRGTTP